MDRAGLLRRASSGEERVLLARVLDKYEQMERRNIPTSTPFLSQAEQAAVQALLNAAGRIPVCSVGGLPPGAPVFLVFVQ